MNGAFSRTTWRSPSRVRTASSGRRCRRRCRAAGHRVRPIVRSAPSGPDELGIDALDLTGIDAVVNLAGEGIGEKRWSPTSRSRRSSSPGRRRRRRSRLRSWRRACPCSCRARPSGYYGDRGDEVLTEASATGTGFLAEVATSGRPPPSRRSTPAPASPSARTGIVLTPTGGALQKMLPLFKLGLGGRMGSGRQWMSWITLEDEVRALVHLLTTDVRGPVNLTAPGPARQADLAKALGRALHRPSAVPTPSFGPRLLLGRELADTLLNESRRVLPKALESSGFDHAHPDLDAALRSLLGK